MAVPLIAPIVLTGGVAGLAGLAGIQPDATATTCRGSAAGAPDIELAGR